MILTDFRKNITDIINQSNLSIDVIYFVMKDIMNEIVSLYNQQLRQEEMNNAVAGQVETNEVKKEEADVAAQNREEEN